MTFRIGRKLPHFPAKVADIEKTSGRKVLQILRTHDSIKIMLLSDLTPHPSNPRRITDKKLKMLEKSLKEFGDLSGIIFNKKTGHLVGGHQRLKVLPADVDIKFENDTDGYFVLNGDRFHVRLVEWDEAKEKAANIAANQHGGDWHLGNLADWVNELDHLNIDMDLLGFDQEELAKLMAPTHYAGQCDEDEIPTPKETRCKRGDIWALGNHRLMCGDSTDIHDVEKLMNNEKADMVFTDPPYGVNMTAKNKLLNNATGQSSLTSGIVGDDLSVTELKPIIQAAFHNIFSVLADKSCYYIASPQGGELGLMMMMQEACIPCRHMIIWVKNAPVFSMGRLDYDYQHEPILYGWAKGKTHNFYGGGEFNKSVWHIDREPNKLHPTMKPVAIIENAVLNSTQKDAVVFDPFSGSASTLIACEKTGRRGRAIEIDSQYIDVSITRWEKFSGKTAHLITGEGQAH